MADVDNRAEVLIVGSGMVGAALAALLGEAGIAVTILDARSGSLSEHEEEKCIGRGRPAPRVSALTVVSQRLLEGLAVWPWMASRRITPYTGMQVWDGEGRGSIEFHASQAGAPVLGHIVENEVTLAALERRLDALPTVTQVFGARIDALQTTSRVRRVLLSDGRCFEAPLVVAADGAHSKLRGLAEIEVREQATGQSAVVTTVRTERGHESVARQSFLPSGPLAFLPLTVEGDERYCSIVWSTTPQHAQQLCAMSPEALGRALGGAFDYRLGEVEAIDNAVSFPLVQRHAEHYVQAGLALVGDAAHSIHPLAGQGVNLGFMDVAVLAEELIEARRRGAGLGDVRILSRYARRRRSDNTAMLALMDGFRLLFGAEHPAFCLARNIGLSGVDRLTPLKRLLIRQAIGERGRLPLSCR